MKLRYYPDTDTLYVDLADRVSERSLEIAPNVIVDLDADGRLVGIEIEHAAQVVDLRDLEADSASLRIAAFRFVSPETP
jgi:uncharacterized protein YuzE